MWPAELFGGATRRLDGNVNGRFLHVAGRQGSWRLGGHRRGCRWLGGFLIGTDAFYPELMGIKSDALELLAESSASHLMAENSIVFAMHQGYQIYWMESSRGDDPPVAMYQEGGAELRARWESFSAFLIDQSSRDLDLTAGQ
ncbi:SMI1/KNR4 family protein [Kitasatospora mediocidica]|uniref:SMI1/KNR4 family protein n=1 Tax=Kitasatospora mediocidica TaxID=58352 RepID=UPI0012F9BF09|nr:SMI1/KNR4 family protein [Kitasatospora mediocidica]